MAVDTASKRASALNVLAASQYVLPIPDTTVAQADMQHLGRLYAGILADAATPSTAATLNQYLTIGRTSLSL